MTKPATPASNDAHIVSSDSDSMEQIRELLFGAQQRSTDERLATTDETIRALRRHSQVELEQAEQRLGERLTQLDNYVDERNAALETALQEGLQTLQQQLEQRIDDVQTELQSEQARLAKELGEEQDRLQLDKVDRKQLARLLGQLAEQIGNP